MTGNTQRAAIVTGASRGIGAAVAERLAHDGFGVAVNYASGATAAEERWCARSRRPAAGPWPRGPTSATPRPCGRCSTMWRPRSGGVDVLVNNAGVMPLATIADTDDATFDRLIAINLRGTFNTLREAARRVRPGGRIINFSSSQSALLMPTYGVYAATKAAVEALTHVLSRELRGRNVTVNASVAWTDRDPALPRGQDTGDSRPPGQARATRASRAA